MPGKEPKKDKEPEKTNKGTDKDSDKKPEKGDDEMDKDSDKKPKKEEKNTKEEPKKNTKEEPKKNTKDEPKKADGPKETIDKIRKIVLIVAIVGFGVGISLLYADDIVSVINSLLGISSSPGATVKHLAMENPYFKEFMDNHTGASMEISFFVKGEANLIFSQMFSDCNLTNSSTIELYRVMVQDDSTGNQIFAWVDWQEKELICVAFGNWQPQCKLRKSVGCFDNNLYWFDSCDQAHELKQSCFGSCSDSTCIPGCLGEGMKINLTNNETCCSDLRSIFDNNVTGNNKCSESNSTFICSNCGDGLCHPHENRCNCPDDCINECIDSDEMDYNNSGSVKRGEIKVRDLCASDSEVVEYYCEYNIIKNQTFKCTVGEECYNGRCLNASRPCSHEGEIIGTDSGFWCCPGLSTANTARPGNDCELILGASVCINCTNGACGLGEDSCNCPGDCEE